MRWLLLLPLLLPCSLAADDFEPAFLSNKQAQRKHAYLRRKPRCLAGAAKETPIAKTLHQIWWQGATEVPAHFEPLRSTWVGQHPDWTHKLWDEAAVQVRHLSAISAHIRKSRPVYGRGLR